MKFVVLSEMYGLIGWIAMKSGVDIHAPLRINLNYVGGLPTFYLATLSDLGLFLNSTDCQQRLPNRTF